MNSSVHQDRVSRTFQGTIVREIDQLVKGQNITSLGVGGTAGERILTALSKVHALFPVP